MAAEIFNKADGTVRAVELDSIQLGDASVVRLQLNCDQVQSMQRAGNDLVISLRDGKQIRIGNFFKTGEADSIHDVVLQDSSGNVWLADPDDATNFCKVAQWGDLFETVGGGEGMGGALLPLLGAGAGIGIIAAAAGGGGGGSKDPSGPGRPTAALVVDSGTPGDKISNQGDVRVSNTEPGAKVEYQIGNGPWTVVTGDTFTLPPGTHAIVNVRQTDVAGNVSPVTNIGPITIDVEAPSAVAGALTADTGLSPVDKITSNGAVQISGAEQGAKVEYQIGSGEWTTVTAGSFTLPTGTHTVVNIRQTDVAGNVGPTTNIGPITVDALAPAAPTGNLAEDTGSSATDKITQNGLVEVEGGEPGALVQYQIGANGEWQTITGGTFTLPEGVHPVVNLRQTDVAGNVSALRNIGPITVDNVDPAAVSGDLVNDNGASASDNLTNDATVQVTDAEEGAIIEYQIGNDGEWTVAPNGQFELPEGLSTVVNVRQTDLAGNVGPETNIGPFEVDTVAPDPITGALENDTGLEDDDGITSDPTVIVDGAEPSSTIEYSTNNGGSWNEVVLDENGSFELPEGEHDNVIIRPVDDAGNRGEEYELGPITVDGDGPAAPSAGLVDDTGSSGADKITKDGRVSVTPDETGGLIEYQIGEDGDWVEVDGGVFTLPPGEYPVVNVRQTDAAGNLGDTFNVGPITVDITPPLALSGVLAADTGLSQEDGITQNGTVNVDTPEPGAIVEYQIGNDGEWIEVEDGQFVLPEGLSQVVNIRQTDVAGNIGPLTNIGPITVDTVAPDAISGDLENDTGDDVGDGITNDPTVIVDGADPGSTIEYSTDDGDSWSEVVLDENGSFELPEGEHDNVIIRPIDDAGNRGEEYELGPITVDTEPPEAIDAALVDDTGSSDIDGNTQDGTVELLDELEAGATAQYQIGNDGEWIAIEDGEFELPPGEYPVVNVRQVDVAGNPSAPTNIGPIIVDIAEPDAPDAELEEDTGASQIDKITNYGVVEVTPAEPGGLVEYQIGDDGDWVEVIGGSFTLEEGIYPVVNVRHTDAAGNASDVVNIGRIEVDQTDPDAVTGELVTDDGSATDDEISSDGRIELTDYESGATVEYSADGIDWTEIDVVDGVITLPPGVYDDLTLRQTDIAGNIGPETNIGDIQIIDADAIDALDDEFDVDLGALSITTYLPDVEADFDVVELLDGTSGYETGKVVEVEGARGDIHVLVQQGSIAAVANAFAVELYDSEGELLYRARTEDSPLVGDVLGLGLLGVLGDGTLEVTFTDLPAGEYRVVVVSDSSALNDLIQGLELSDVGLDNTVLGSSNRDLILDAIENALSDPYVTEQTGDNPLLATTVTNLLGTVLDLADGTPLPYIVNLVNSTLSLIGATEIADFVIDAVADALLSNLVTAFQTTILETTLVEYNFDTTPVTGNVLEDNGNGPDDLDGTVTVISVTYDDPDPLVTDPSELVVAGPGTQIEGLYGTLTIRSDGSFDYVPNGNPDSIGKTEVFTYTISNGLYQDTASLSFAIGGDAPPAITVDAINDVKALDMGEMVADAPVTTQQLNVAVVEWLPTAFSPQNGMQVTVPADRSGAMIIAIEQQALLSAAPAFRVDVYNAFGEIVHTAVAADSFFGDAPGLSLFGYEGGNRLTTTVEGLPEGDYYIIVSNAPGALDNIIQGLSLADLGDGAVLGAENQAIIVTAVEQFLATNLGLPPELSGPVLITLNGILGVANYGTPLVDIVDDIVDLISPLAGAVGLIDDFVDDLSAALISNYFSFLEATDISATVIGYDFPVESTGGNVLTDGDGADDVPDGTLVRSVTNSDGETESVFANGPAVIHGEYGVLTLSQDGTYTYEAYGDPGSIGQSDVFTYSISYFNRTDTATLTINIDGDSIELTPDVDYIDPPYVYTLDSNYHQNSTLFVSAIIPVNRAIITSFDINPDVVSVLGEIRVDIVAGLATELTLELLYDQGDDTWVLVPGASKTIDLGLELLGSEGVIDLSALDLPPGEYRVVASTPATIGLDLATVTITTDVDAYLEPLVLSPSMLGPHEGTLLDNDGYGSLFPTVAVRAAGEDDYEGTDDGPVPIEGAYGTLTVNPDGTYSYTTDANKLPAGVSGVEDVFEYQVTLPSGEFEEATLTIVHDSDPSMSGFMLMNDSSLDSLLDGYLGDEPPANAPPVPADMVDPLSYLETPQQEDLQQPAFV